MHCHPTDQKRPFCDFLAPSPKESAFFFSFRGVKRKTRSGESEERAVSICRFIFCTCRMISLLAILDSFCSAENPAWDALLSIKIGFFTKVFFGNSALKVCILYNAAGTETFPSPVSCAQNCTCIYVRIEKIKLAFNYVSVGANAIRDFLVVHPPLLITILPSQSVDRNRGGKKISRFPPGKGST